MPRWLAGLLPSLVTLLLLPIGAEWYARRALDSQSAEHVRRMVPGPFKLLGETADLASAAGARPFILVFLAEGAGVGEYGEAAEAVALERDLPFLRYDGPRMDFVHPTREGYAALAGALLDGLLAAGDLPPRG